MPGKRVWHPEEIKAQVRMRGKTLTQLAIEAGLNGSACRLALIKPFYRPEQAIAAFIGVPAQDLWPDRYDPDGTPRHPRARRNPSHPPQRRHCRNYQEFLT